MKWFSIAVAAAGISVMTWELGRFPLIAVGLASTFALYGAVKKKLNLDAFYSTTLETFFVLPFALAYVLSLGNGGMGHFNVDDLRTAVFLIGAGAVTATPLVLFSIGANDLPLNVLGFCQYISPSITLLLGIFLSANLYPCTGVCFFFYLVSSCGLYDCGLERKEVFGKTGNERFVRRRGKWKHFIGV